jgi:general stress protein YciG
MAQVSGNHSSKPKLIPRRLERRVSKQEKNEMPNQQSGNRGQGEGNKGQQSGDTSKRGFASMDDDKQREIASKGGEASGGNFKNDPDRAAEAGKKGGQSSSGGDGGGSDRGGRSSRCSHGQYGRSSGLPIRRRAVYGPSRVRLSRQSDRRSCDEQARYFLEPAAKGNPSRWDGSNIW